ncbi:MAG: hypothetical protein COV47_01355 [Candidatus Diapherotrites archaeon CG11_big_fil_rev_8_21_14_0_20_37_9]|nr:MAG: hypothetical protein COV47_01355 [Candidatus Diapherotrites archaeon CG11_big_fil_rev_8_21_14_0_20_37_9]
MRDDTNCIEGIKEKVRKGNWHPSKKKAFLDYLAYLGANDKAMRTIYLYANNVHRLGNYLPAKPFEGYSQKDIIDFKTELKKTYAPYSTHNFLLDCQTFLKWHLKIDNCQNQLHL